MSNNNHQPSVGVTEQTLLEQFCGIALHKQMDFYDVIGNRNWNADLDIGEISFGDGLDFPIQSLGTFSHGSQTWLWAWANPQAGYSERFLQQAQQLKDYGEAHQLDLLTIGRLNARPIDMHIIGSIASGMFNAGAYYIADYGQGAMVVTLKSPRIDNAYTDSHARVLTVIPQMMTMFEVNHQRAITHYLAAKGYTLTKSGNTLNASKNNQHLHAEFDYLERLVNLTGEISPD